jgi:pimeloyl-ACP methyl ester carboxylesterase
VVIVDLLGFGSSPAPASFEDLWTDAQARALAQTLDRLAIDRAALVGHDYGGPVAIAFYSRFPERVTHLGLLSTNTFSDTPVDLPLSLVRVPAVGGLVERVLFSSSSLNALGRAASKTPRIHPARTTGDDARTIRTIFGNVLRDLERLYRPVEAVLATITVPTVVIWGDRDMFFSAQQGQRTAGAIPDARFVLLEGCGHFPPIERPDRVASLLVELLN